MSARTFLVHSYSGFRNVECAGTYGPFAVTRSLEAGDDLWRITHAATGFAIKGPMPVEVARAGAEALARFADEFDGKHVDDVIDRVKASAAWPEIEAILQGLPA